MKVLNNREKSFTYIVFGIYFILLVWLVLFKLSTSIDDIPHMRGINLIPFHYDEKTDFHLKEVLYNVIIFIPAGFYFTAFFEKRRKWYAVAVTALVSILFECLQWVFYLGATDITDVMTNTLGGLLGMFLFVIMGKLFPKRRMTIINILGIFVEVSACLLIVILILAN